MPTIEQLEQWERDDTLVTVEVPPNAPKEPFVEVARKHEGQPMTIQIITRTICDDTEEFDYWVTLFLIHSDNRIAVPDTYVRLYQSDSTKAYLQQAMAKKLGA